MKKFNNKFPCSVGKSTILNTLKSSLKNTEIYLEPVEQWCKLEWGGKLYYPLDEFYNDKQLFELQTFIQSSYIRNLSKTYQEAEESGKLLFFTERRLSSSVDIFSALAYEKGLLSPKNYALLQYNMETYKLLKPVFFQYDAIFHLFCNTKTCLERICTRRRDEERNISPDYLSGLERIYQQYYRKETNGLVTEIDANMDSEALLHNILNQPILQAYQ